MALAVLTLFYLGEPEILSLGNMTLERVQHHNEFIFVESMRSALSLSLPLIVSLTEKEGVAKKVLEEANKGASLIKLSILGNDHGLHDICIRYEQVEATDTHGKDWMRFIVKGVELFRL